MNWSCLPTTVVCLTQKGRSISNIEQVSLVVAMFVILLTGRGCFWDTNQSLLLLIIITRRKQHNPFVATHMPWRWSHAVYFLLSPSSNQFFFFIYELHSHFYIILINKKDTKEKNKIASLCPSPMITHNSCSKNRLGAQLIGRYPSLFFFDLC